MINHWEIRWVFILNLVSDWLTNENPSKPNVKLTNFDDGYITCKIASNYVGNVNVTFATSFNGISTSKPHLYSVVGADYDLTNFQLTPKISSIENNSGSIAGGNEVVLNGGPFLEDETKVTFDGVEAEVISQSGVFLKFARQFHWLQQF